jgi:alkaline phosphatase D
MTHVSQDRLIIFFLILGYKELKKSVPIVGVWDDHDYGINNGDYTFKMKGELRDLYLDFIGEP